MNSAPLLVGVDVGGTNLRIGVVRQLQVVWEYRHEADFSRICRSHAPQQALEKIIDELAAAIEQARRQYPGISSVGIGFPGFIDPVSNIVSLSPNLPGLHDVDVARPLADRLGVRVRMENDALAAAYGEYLLAQPQPESLIYLGLGTGVGGGMILGGRPYPGMHGVAMEVGHLTVQPGGRPCGCGNRGCLEQYASASGVAITYEQLSKSSKDTGQIAELAIQGDRKAQAAFHLAAESLAMALAHILKIVDVTQVVIGGGMSNAWPLLQPVFDAHLNDALIPALRGRIQIAVSRAGDQAGMLGAASLSAD